MIPPFVEDAAVWISIATVPSLIITYCAWIRRPGISRTIILYMAGSVAIAAYTLDVADRLDWISLSNKGPVVQQFGVKGAPETNNNALYVIVNSAPLLKYQDKFNMMLIAASMYSNIDMMTDVHIDKSSPFSITGGITNVAIPIDFGTTHLLISQPPNMRPGDKYRVPVALNLVIIPKDLSAEQLRSLSDVQRLGGKIIQTPSTDLLIQ